MALAQGPASGQFSETPVCSDLVNKSGHTVFGEIQTHRVQKSDGEIIYYSSNFRLAKDEATKICSSGPFFEGQRIRLKLRSLVPLFECKTRLGDVIAINAAPKKEGRGYDWSATCY